MATSLKLYLVRCTFALGAKQKLTAQSRMAASQAAVLLA